MSDNHSPKISNESADAAANAVCDLADGGVLKIYDGTKPLTANTDPGADTHILSEHALTNPAETDITDGVATFDAIGDDTSAKATAGVGGASWFRVFKANGTSPVFDGTVGVTGSESDMEMPTVAIQQYATVSVTFFTYTAAKG